MSWSDIPGRAAYLWIYDEFVADAPIASAVVEVGVALGKSLAYCARSVLDAGRGDIAIYGVDAWGGYARNGEQQRLNPIQQGDPRCADGDLQLFLDTMHAHAPIELTRIKTVRATSVDGASWFADSSLDLVVLDADHTYDAVAGDLAAWLPKLKPGGHVGGDDWMPEHPGVERAVRERLRDVEVRIVDGWGTWRCRV